MRVLAIETAAEACSIALFAGERIVARDHRVIGRGHAEALVPMIAGLPEKGRADRILVSLGPGSFTGVRIGLATARALGLAWGAEVLGYPTLALVAAQARAAHSGAAVTVCMNGGHGEWFVADFDPQGRAEGEVASLTPQAASARSVHRLIAGNRAAELVAARGEAGATALALLPATALALLPDAARTVLLAPDMLTAALAPIYGRGPDATPMAARRVP